MGDGIFQKIHAKDGVLYFENDSEVLLWGVNFQPCLSWEHAARMENQNLLMPLKERDLKQAADEGFDEIEQLGADLIRIHLTPADFTDAEGNLHETIWLRMLDYTLAQAQDRGIYVYLSFLNHMTVKVSQFPPNTNSFAVVFSREEWISDPVAVDATENYIRQLLNRRNPYNGLLYKNLPTLALLEPINEPDYAPPDEGRYEQVKTCLNRMVRIFREEGMTQPVVWNCGWPRLIQGHEDVFQAIADSAVDAVSFCNYPGQDDLKPPFWKYPRDLSATNYLPYLELCEQDDWLGWLRRDEFADKARVVYEYETMCNQSAYMYPAMAEFFRSLGVQVAALWTYGLPSYAEYLGGTHVFNLKTTPRKAAAFMAAGQTFKNVPRVGKTGPSFQWSYPQNLSAGFCDETLIHSGDLPDGFIPVSAPERIVGVGSSSFVKYEGSGLYFIEPCENDALRVTILPDPEFIRPHWIECHTGDQVVQLDTRTPHPFELNLPILGTPRWLYRKNGWRWEFQGRLDESIRFNALPGEYLIEKEELVIDREILEQEWYRRLFLQANLNIQYSFADKQRRRLFRSSLPY